MIDSEHGRSRTLGRCGGTPWDGHSRQRPWINHLCAAFRSTGGRPNHGVTPRDALVSDKCRCGVSKNSGLPLCYQCWCRLPVEIRSSLNRSCIDYEQAYEAAAAHLDAEEEKAHAAAMAFLDDEE